MRRVELGNDAAPLARIRLKAGERKDHLEIRLPLNRNRAIEGRVLDPSGRPLANASVWATTLGNRSVGLLSSKTPGTGIFHIGSILTTCAAALSTEEIHELSVHAWCENYEPGRVDGVAVGTKGLEVVLILERRGRIACRLYDAHTGDTISEAEVYLLHTDTAWGESRPNIHVKGQISSRKGATKDPSGRFILEEIPAGLASLLVNTEQYGALAKDDIAVVAGETTEVSIPLETCGLVCARVPDSEKLSEEGWWLTSGPIQIGAAHGELPLKDLRERVKAEIPCSLDEPTSKTHQHIHLAPGRYDLRMSLSCYNLDDRVETPGSAYIRGTAIVHTVPIVVESDSVTAVELEMSDLATQYGSLEVIVGQDWALGSRLEIMPEEYGTHSGETMSNGPNGRFRQGEFLTSRYPSPYQYFPLVPRGDYTVAYFPPSERTTPSEPSIEHVTVSAGETAQVVID